MSFRMRRGRASFSVGPRGPRASYRLGCAIPSAIVVALFAFAGCSGSLPADGAGQLRGPDATTNSPLSTQVPQDVSHATFDPGDEATAEPAPLKISKVSLTSTVRTGANASLTIKTTAGASCSIDVQYSSGSSTAKGLGEKKTNSAGKVTWNWMVGTRTTEGRWPILVYCSQGHRDGLLELSFKVI